VRFNILTEPSDFEQIRDYQDNDIKLPGPREVANFEDYFRRELPIFFRKALESAVSHEMEPIEAPEKKDDVHS
jgi:hypothetical protein